MYVICKYSIYKARVRLFDCMSFYLSHRFSTHHLQQQFQAAITGYPREHVAQLFHVKRYIFTWDSTWLQASPGCQVSLGFLFAAKLSLLLLQAPDLALKVLPLPAKRLQFPLLSFAGHSCHLLGVQQTRLARRQFLSSTLRQKSVRSRGSSGLRLHGKGWVSHFGYPIPQYPPMIRNEFQIWMIWPTNLLFCPNKITRHRALAKMLWWWHLSPPSSHLSPPALPWVPPTPPEVPLLQ